MNNPRERRINSMVAMGHVLLSQGKMYRKMITVAVEEEGITMEEIRAALDRAGITCEMEVMGLIDPEDPIMVAMKRKAEAEINERELATLLAEKAKRDGGGPRV